MRTQKLSTVEEIEMEPPSVAVSKEKHESESLVEEEYNDEDGNCVEIVWRLCTYRMISQMHL